ncbi:MAG: RNA polymerase sigma factor [Candidatus Krumholzibacteriota bacterium]|nr:RNA polymerase sigma factor [Candidatus Krumholzibacteriota bacterium]
MPGPDDETIVQLVLGGDVDRFSALLERHRRYVFGIVAGHVPPESVEEIAHDVFVRAYRSLAAWKGTGGFRHWLAGIAVRTCKDFWRRRYRSRETTMNALSAEQADRIERAVADESAPDGETVFASREAAAILDWAMENLSAVDQTILRLVNIEERPVREAAGLLGISEANVKVRGFRARRKLRTVLERMLHGEKDTG